MVKKHGATRSVTTRRGTPVAHLAFLALGLGLFACKESTPESSEDQGPVAIDSEGLALAVAKISMCEGNDNGTAVHYYSQYARLWSGVDAPEPLSGSREEALRAEVECLGSASCCEDVWRCRGGLPEQACDPSTFLESDCDGDFVVVCAEFDHPETPFIWRKEDCSLNEDGATQCINGQCAISTCDDEATPDYCEGDDGNRICYDGVLSAEDCGPFKTCVEFPEEGQTGCEFGVPCEGPTHCAGNTVVRCEDGWERQRTVCSRLGLECVEFDEAEGGGAGCVVPADPAQCDDGDGQCDGTVIRLCFAGQPIEIDCGVLAGGTCAELDGSESSNSGLSCVLSE